ncbi:MAG: hypothetical protein AAF547_11905 [Actinomycetota bacterium]
MIGGLIGFVLPPFLFGFSLAVLDSADAIPAVIQILIPIALAIAVPVALFLAINRRWGQGTTEQQQMLPTVRVMCIIALALYGIGVVVIGGCIALLIGAYQDV